MSAAFRLAKQKVSQNDLRRLMQEQKQSRIAGESSTAAKIDSPFAKYDGSGNLTCQLCKSVVRSSAVWKVHINSKQHKENLVLAKQLKEKIENQGKQPAAEDRLAALKRNVELLRSESEVPEKKPRGILKTSSSYQPTPPQPVKTQNDEPTPAPGPSSIPADFFDAKPKPPIVEKANKTEEKPNPDETIPEGFFDDPMKDAKARNVEYKDPSEEEWEKFQKEIKEAEAESMAIINDEHEEATVERQIDEIDAQMRNWSRVLELEKKKEMIESKLKQENGFKVLEENAPSSESEDEEEEEEKEELPELLDWRAKKIH